MRQPSKGRLYTIWLGATAPANAGEGDLWMPSAAPTSPLERQRRWVAMSLRLDAAPEWLIEMVLERWTYV